MAKSDTKYICTNCEATYPAWQGKCTSCNQWNTIVRDNFDGSKFKTANIKNVDLKTKSLNEIEINLSQRNALSINSLNEVLGGGLVNGQVVLFAGEPGIGKSTLLTQICVNSELSILYISGEESVEQIARRASRISKLSSFENTQFSNDIALESIVAQISSKNFDLVIIDSIQTIYSSEVSGFPGSMNQIRECANYITGEAKKSNVAVIMIGQITKGGNIAGPKILEHIVDTVLYFEGENNDTRILKVIKNRFGSTNEIAIFEMKNEGLSEVKDAELYFINNMNSEEGVAFTIHQEGSLSLVLEIQALCTKTSFAYPKRVANGYDSKRLEMLIAILTKKLNLKLEFYDIYVNVIGGIKIDDTSADLAVAMAILSSLKSKTLPQKSCYIGELSLTGEIRSVTKQEQRTKKAKKFGFKSIYSSENTKTIGELKLN
jgi:DNA repair protein RadA/Sms